MKENSLSVEFCENISSTIAKGFDDLVNDYVNICGYGRESAIKASLATFEEELI